MGDAYKAISSSSKTLHIFNMSAKYFADEWATDGTSDILILSVPAPENAYFSEVVIYFLNTGAYKKANIEKTIV